MRGLFTYKALALFVLAVALVGCFMMANQGTVPVYLVAEGSLSQEHGLYQEMPVWYVAFGGIAVGIFLTMVFQLPHISRLYKDVDDFRARLNTARQRLKRRPGGGEGAKVGAKPKQPSPEEIRRRKKLAAAKGKQAQRDRPKEEARAKQRPKAGRAEQAANEETPAEADEALDDEATAEDDAPEPARIPDADVDDDEEGI